MIAVRLERIGGVLAGVAGGRVPRERRAISVRLTDDTGTIGVGEAAPLPGYGADDLESAAQQLAAWSPPRRSPSDVAAVAGAVAEFTSPAARYAAETALLDLVGQHVGCPVHRLLTDRNPCARPLRWLVTADAAGDATLARAWADGVRDVKLKVGLDDAVERAALARWRSAYPGLRVVVDANGTLPADDVVSRCAAYVALGVQAIEEPVPADVLLRLPVLPLPVALDESLQGNEATRWLAALASRCDVTAVVLKPTVLGGVLVARALAITAAGFGLDAIVTHTFDGPVAMVAAAELALALPGTAAAGLGPHPLLSVFPGWRGAALTTTQIVPHDRPGLGMRGC